MTMPYFDEVTCPLCQRKTTICGLASTNTFFEMVSLELRSDSYPIEFMIQSCDHCGYSADDLEEPVPEGITLEWVKNVVYPDNMPDLAKNYYMAYAIQRHIKELIAAHYYILGAAWACDDEKSTSCAKQCRDLAIELATEILDDAAFQETEDGLTLILQTCDSIRRNGYFERVPAWLDKYHFFDRDLPDYLETVAKREISLAKEKNDSIQYTRGESDFDMEE